MDNMTTIKKQQVKGLATEAIENICEHYQPSSDPSNPLAGIVHIDGIGQVPMYFLRAELVRRAVNEG